MKKLRIFLSVFLIMAVFINGIAPIKQVYAKTTVYETCGCYVKTFKKSKGRIIIETIRNDSDTELEKPIKLKLKPAKNIKYTLYNIGETKPYGKTKFKNLQEDFKAAYEEYMKTGEYNSPPGVNIYVKNKQITEIRLTFS